MAGQARETAGKFAQGTVVPAEKSQAELERTLARYGASAFLRGWSEDRSVAQVMFEVRGRRVRFTIVIPDRSDKRFTHDRTGHVKSPAAMRAAYEAEIRRLWRALLLVIKAKLEAAESGIISFEEEFLPHIVLADGRTVAETLGPDIEQLYVTGQVPALLPGTGER
jgi:hypothetical protein